MHTPGPINNRGHHVLFVLVGNRINSLSSLATRILKHYSITIVANLILDNYCYFQNPLTNLSSVAKYHHNTKPVNFMFSLQKNQKRFKTFDYRNLTNNLQSVYIECNIINIILFMEEIIILIRCALPIINSPWIWKLKTLLQGTILDFLDIWIYQ